LTHAECRQADGAEQGGVREMPLAPAAKFRPENSVHYHALPDRQGFNWVVRHGRLADGVASVSGAGGMSKCGGNGGKPIQSAPISVDLYINTANPYDSAV
jgi:hypothetical protein